MDYWNAFIKYSIDNSQFWELSLNEMASMIKARTEFIEEQYKATIMTNFALAQNIAVFVGMSLNGKELPTVQEVYPELFKEHVKDEASERELSWQFYKEQMLDFANQYNAKRAKRLEREVNSN